MTLEIIWRDPAGQTHRKAIPWRRPATEAALTEYLEEYTDLLNNGYRPDGFLYTPFPHCLRVKHLAAVLAELILRPKFSAESRVTADERLGRGGIPAAVPIAPCSECLGVPTHLDPRPKDSVENRRDPSNVTRLGQAALTKG